MMIRMKHLINASVDAGILQLDSLKANENNNNQKEPKQEKEKEQEQAEEKPKQV